MKMALQDDPYADHFIEDYLTLMDRLMSWNNQNINWHCSYLGTKTTFVTHKSDFDFAETFNSV